MLISYVNVEWWECRFCSFLKFPLYYSQSLYFKLMIKKRYLSYVAYNNIIHYEENYYCKIRNRSLFGLKFHCINIIIIYLCG